MCHGWQASKTPETRTSTGFAGYRRGQALYYFVKPLILIIAALLLPAAAQASLRCQERTAGRVCLDNAPRMIQVAGTNQSVPVSPPTMPGYASACWSWQRAFECVETDPIQTCQSGSNFNTVQSTCQLSAVSGVQEKTINGFRYVIDATYDYRCQFGAYTTSDTLPAGKECVKLNETVTDGTTIAVAPTGTPPTQGSGTATITTASLTETTALTQNRVDNYVCYSDPVTTCSDTCFENVVDRTTGKMEVREVPCAGVISNCVVSSNEPTNALTTGPDGSIRVAAALGPDGRPVESTSTAMCQAGSIPRCLERAGCNLYETSAASIQTNGVALQQNQTYLCSNEERSCVKKALVSNCVSPNAWGWDQNNLTQKVGVGLVEANAAFAQLEAIEKGQQANDPYIFSGTNRTCHIAVGNFWGTFVMAAITVGVAIYTAGGISVFTGPGGVMGGLGANGVSTGFLSQGLQAAIPSLGQAGANALGASISVGAQFAQDASNSKTFGNNCCKDFVIQGSDSWYKVNGKCSANEVKLAVARGKGLAHYIGEWCSKSQRALGLFKSCVQKSHAYCVFDDMLALVINEQGRAQLDAIASADSATTIATAEQPFSLYAPEVANPTQYSDMANGGWRRILTQGGSQIWYWQFAGYCRTPEAQQAAYARYTTEIQDKTDTTGVTTKAQAQALLQTLNGLVAFQDCAEAPGIVSYMTCSKGDDTCDTARLPESPTGAVADLSGETIDESDLNWTIQTVNGHWRTDSFGVTTTLPGDSTFAAVSASVNAFITATGSCHGDGACRYRFAITDKQANGGFGARKRVKGTARFPLYSDIMTSYWPTVDFVSPTGTLDTAAYNADPNKGLGTPVVVGTHRFLFHPNWAGQKPATGQHSHFLLDWAWKPAPENDALFKPETLFNPVLVPTNLPPVSAGWSPYAASPLDSTISPVRQKFHLDGGCNPATGMCDYNIGVDLDVQRHPWGSPQNPNCHGFTLEQMSVLDFSKMDLSRWINSLNLSSFDAGVSSEAAQAMADAATSTAQSYYNNFQGGGGTAVPKTGGGMQSLYTNTDTLPTLRGEDLGSSYTLQIAVPSNWPMYYTTGGNNNPVSNVWVDWGDGSAPQSVPLAEGGKAFAQIHDYGGAPTGRSYKVSVTLDTQDNGSQRLSTMIQISADQGAQFQANTGLDFNSAGVSGDRGEQIVPSTIPTQGSSQSVESLRSLAPGMADLMEANPHVNGTR